MTINPIDEAARIVGSQVALANALGVTKSAVNQWKLDGRKVPAKHCPAIERLTNNQVRCNDLRPDIDWSGIESRKRLAHKSAGDNAPTQNN